MLKLDKNLDIIENERKNIEEKRKKFRNKNIYKYLEIRKTMENLYDLQEQILSNYELNLNDNPQIENKIKEKIIKLEKNAEKLETQIFNFMKYEIFLIILAITIFILFISFSNKLNFNNFNTFNLSIIGGVSALIFLFLVIQKIWKENLEKKFKTFICER